MVAMKRISAEVLRGDASVPSRLRHLNRSQLHAVLSTDAEGRPYTSLIAFALTPDLKEAVFLTPRSTAKYSNIVRNSNVSLLIDNRSNSRRDYSKAEAITILGNALPLRRGRRWTGYAQVLLRKHPQLGAVLDAPGTSLVVVKFTRCVHVTEFQKVTVWDVRSPSEDDG
jgi:heme iron utilization protein